MQTPVESEDSSSDSKSSSESSSDDSSSDYEKPEIKPKKKKTKLEILREKKDETDKDNYNLVISKNRFELMMELLK